MKRERSFAALRTTEQYNQQADNAEGEPRVCH